MGDASRADTEIASLDPATGEETVVRTATGDSPGALFPASSHATSHPGGLSRASADPATAARGAGASFPGTGALSGPSSFGPGSRGAAPTTGDQTATLRGRGPYIEAQPMPFGGGAAPWSNFTSRRANAPTKPLAGAYAESAPAPAAPPWAPPAARMAGLAGAHVSGSASDPSTVAALAATNSDSLVRRLARSLSDGEGQSSAGDSGSSSPGAAARATESGAKAPLSGDDRRAIAQDLRQPVSRDVRRALAADIATSLLGSPGQAARASSGHRPSPFPGDGPVGNGPTGDSPFSGAGRSPSPSTRTAVAEVRAPAPFAPAARPPAAAPAPAQNGPTGLSIEHLDVHVTTEPAPAPAPVRTSAPAAPARTGAFRTASRYYLGRT